MLNILASVINLADIEFVESDQGNAEIRDAAAYCHGEIVYENIIYPSVHIGLFYPVN